MIVEYRHPRYDFEAAVNTANFAADFLFTHKTIVSEGSQPIDDRAWARLDESMGKIALLHGRELVRTDDIDGNPDSPSLPKVLISASILLEPASDFMRGISPGAVAALRYPITPEIVEKGLADSALGKCALLIVREFEGMMVPRT
jgi:hypothetical protein